MREVKTKYTNLGKSTRCADPKDTKILALTTKLDNLEKKFASNGGSGEGGKPKGSGKSNSGGKKNNRPPAWKMKHKGDTIEHDEQKCQWCKEHKHEGT
eukprot:7879203-Ditylum_brightwellii.AAC.1